MSAAAGRVLASRRRLTTTFWIYSTPPVSSSRQWIVRIPSRLLEVPPRLPLHPSSQCTLRWEEEAITPDLVSFGSKLLREKETATLQNPSRFLVFLWPWVECVWTVALFPEHGSSVCRFQSPPLWCPIRRQCLQYPVPSPRISVKEDYKMERVILTAMG